MLKHEDKYATKMLTVEIPHPSTMTVAEFSSPASKKSRCPCCKKKLGLIFFTCKCGGNYCAEHRMGEHHACTFDYKQEATKRLEEQLVRVVGEKISKI
jgi:predicted nucleic acid binding AN1-type Zn finger protein